jgi:putative endonuclease
MELVVNSAVGRLAQFRINLEERALDGLTRVARRRGGLRESPAHLLTGIDGERAAYFHLRRKGYEVVARRWSAGNIPGDIDVIAWHGALLCFIEVKTRTAMDITPAEVAVDSYKRSILRRLARNYLRQLPDQAAPEVRFDVVSVYLVPNEPKVVRHFEGAFGWSEGRTEG